MSAIFNLPASSSDGAVDSSWDGWTLRRALKDPIKDGRTDGQMGGVKSNLVVLVLF